MVRLRSGSLILSFLLGALLGFFLAVAVAAWAAFHLADWLVVRGEAHPADAVIVLGGGGGSRLRKGLELYDRGWVAMLVLVDTKASYWDAMLARWCPDCKSGGKLMTILTGSTSTLTDAKLVREYCEETGMKRILVVTDPYHTRRASIFFHRELAGSGIEVTTVSSGDYGHRLPPTTSWWRDERTLLDVGMEAAKIVAFFLQGVP